MHMKLETMPSYRVAYIRRVGPYGADNGQTMEALKRWATERNLLNDQSVILGVAHDGPAVTPPERCRYDACIVVAEGYSIEGCAEGRIASGSYAVFTVKHTAEAVQKAWLDIYPELIRHAHAPDASRPVLERYATHMVKNHLCEICVPVQRG